MPYFSIQNQNESKTIQRHIQRLDLVDTIVSWLRAQTRARLLGFKSQLTPPFTSFLDLEKWLNLSVCQFPQITNQKGMKVSSSYSCCKDEMSPLQLSI